MKKLVTLAILLMFLAASCKKDLRTKVYSLRAYNNSTLTGQVSFIETKDKDSVIVKLEADGLVPNAVYPTHFHTGTTLNLINTLIHFVNLQSPTEHINREEKWNESFDNAINSNTCFTVHIPTYTSNDTSQYEIAGNLGANAP
jgi:hypothetical protein